VPPFSLSHDSALRLESFGVRVQNEFDEQDTENVFPSVSVTYIIALGEPFEDELPAHAAWKDDSESNMPKSEMRDMSNELDEVRDCCNKFRRLFQVAQVARAPDFRQTRTGNRVCHFCHLGQR